MYRFIVNHTREQYIPVSKGLFDTLMDLIRNGHWSADDHVECVGTDHGYDLTGEGPTLSAIPWG